MLSIITNSMAPVNHLTAEEQQDPERVIGSFFETFSMEEVRTEMTEAMETAVKKKFNQQPYSIEEDNLRFFYEKIIQVVEAAWLLRC